MTALEELRGLLAGAQTDGVKAFLQGEIDRETAEAKSAVESLEAHFAGAEAELQALWAKVKGLL